MYVSVKEIELKPVECFIKALFYHLHVPKVSSNINLLHEV